MVEGCDTASGDKLRVVGDDLLDADGAGSGAGAEGFPAGVGAGVLCDGYGSGPGAAAATAGVAARATIVVRSAPLTARREKKIGTA